MCSNEVFTGEEIKCLEEDNIFLPTPPGSHTRGKRKVSASLMSSPSSSISSSSSSASVRTWNFRPSTINIDIPTEEESAAVLEYLGFKTSVASEIFQRYAGRPDPQYCPDDLLDYAFGQISVLKTPSYRTMDIREAMDRAGLNLQIQSAIADPAFSDILWTRDLHFWVKDTIETNLATLRSRQLLLKRHARERLAHKNKRKKRSSVQGLFSSQEGPARQGPEQAAFTSTINMTTSDFNLPAAHVALSETEPPILPNHVVLYKGKAYWDLRETLRIIQDDGSIDMTTLATPAGGDFNSNFNAHYWIPEKDTGQRYQQWAALRSPTSDTCLIRIQVSNDFIERLSFAGMWFSPDWREFVWHCKQEKDPPPKFDYLRNVDVIKGHICTGTTRAIRQIAAADVQTHISRAQLVPCTSTGRPAIQWMFQKSGSIKLLADEIRGKTHIEIFAALT